jgi:hypothetical protein
MNNNLESSNQKSHKAQSNQRNRKYLDKVAKVDLAGEEKLNFVLLLGGTVPRRYLEVEAGSGLDWIWEHRVQDLSALLDWYKSQ